MVKCTGSFTVTTLYPYSQFPQTRKALMPTMRVKMPVLHRLQEVYVHCRTGHLLPISQDQIKVPTVGVVGRQRGWRQRVNGRHSSLPPQMHQSGSCSPECHQAGPKITLLMTHRHRVGTTWCFTCGSLVKILLM